MTPDNWFFQFAVIGLPLIGLVGTFLVEILLLSTRNWVTKKQSFIYPIVTFVVNVPAAFLLYFVNFFVVYFLMMVLGMGLMSLTQEMTGDSNSAKYGMVVSIVIIAVVSLILHVIAFFLLRLLTTKIIVKPQTLTWRYVLVQAFILALFCAMGFQLVQIASVFTEPPI